MSLICGGLNASIESFKPILDDVITTIQTHYYSEPSIFFQCLQTWDGLDQRVYCLEDAHLIIIADSRLVNRAELLDRLQLDAGNSEATDCFLILSAYKKWDSECLQHLIGDFVFAIWDTKRKTLFMARDPLGQRTLFFLRKGIAEFYFSNLPRPLIALANDSGINKSKVACFLTLVLADNSSFFQSIEVLPGGHYLKFCSANAQIQIQRYWSAQAIVQSATQSTNASQYYAAFHDLYQKIIRETLTLDSVVCQLSGGLDSSSTTCMAASLLQNDSLTAFAHVPSVPSSVRRRLNCNYDDTALINTVLDQYKNIDLHYIRDHEKNFFEFNDELHLWSGYPMAAPCNLLWIMKCVEGAKKLGKKIILSGEGGNFTISWEGLNPRTAQQKFTVRSLLRRMRPLILTDYPWAAFAAINKKLVTDTNLLSRFQTRRTATDPRPEIFDCEYNGEWSAWATAIRFLYGIEFKDPTVDRRIVEFCLRCPPEIFRQAQQSRLLVRLGLRDLLPARIRERTTRGLQAADWYYKLDRQKQEIMSWFTAWKKTNIAYFLDLNQLIELMNAWELARVAKSEGEHYVYYKNAYRMKVLIAAEVGHFLSKFV